LNPVSGESPAVDDTSTRGAPKVNIELLTLTGASTIERLVLPQKCIELIRDADGWRARMVSRPVVGEQLYYWFGEVEWVNDLIRTVELPLADAQNRRHRAELKRSLTRPRIIE